MMLPEHREAWLAHREMLQVKEKPILDEQELQLIHRTLIDSYNQRLRVRIRVFDPVEDKIFEGIVSTVNIYLKEIKLVFGEDWKYIKIADIMSANI